MNTLFEYLTDIIMILENLNKTVIFSFVLTLLHHMLTTSTMVQSRLNKCIVSAAPTNEVFPLFVPIALVGTGEFSSELLNIINAEHGYYI